MSKVAILSFPATGWENAVKSAIQEQIEAQPVQQQTIPTFPTKPGAGENAQETGAATPGE